MQIAGEVEETSSSSNEATKHCRGCGQTLPISAFYQRHSRAYGPCRQCRCQASQRRYRSLLAELNALRDALAAYTKAGVIPLLTSRNDHDQKAA